MKENIMDIGLESLQIKYIWNISIPFYLGLKLTILDLSIADVQFIIMFECITMSSTKLSQIKWNGGA